MTTKVVGLRPDRAYLDPNFNGYKLSLDEIPILTTQLPSPVDRVLPSPEQYSLLHAKLFGVHNHLIGDYVDGFDSVYCIDNEWRIKKACIDTLNNELSLLDVWEIPKPNERKRGCYNVSLKFASEKLAVVCDGSGVMFILNTGSRNDDDTWQVLFSDEVIGPDTAFIICDVLQVENQLHCLLLNIQVIFLLA